MTQAPSNGYAGHATPRDATTAYGNAAFLTQALINKVQTATVVQVKAVTNAGGLSPVGYVDVLPLVHQIDGDGNTEPHAVVHSIPYARIQGGANAIILDPQVDDIGICVFASRDISKVKVTKKASPPGSRRRYAFSDGMYIGGLLNGTPSQFIQFTGNHVNITAAAGVTITAPGTLTLQTPLVVTTGNVQVGTGASGSFTTPTGQTVVVKDGIVTLIS